VTDDGNTDDLWEYIHYLEWRLTRVEEWANRSRSLMGGMGQFDQPLSFDEWRKAAANFYPGRRYGGPP
jgi:hypothetical protein